MYDQMFIGDVQAAYIHLNVARDVLRAGYTMRRQSMANALFK